MNEAFFINRESRSRQQGAVLLVAMIILLIMAVLGLSSLMSSTLQERMAANTRQSDLALFSAEAALKQAELWLDANVRATVDLSQFDGSNGLYSNYRDISIGVGLSPVNDSLADTTDESDWVAGNSVAVAGILSDEVTANDPRYIIEYVGRDVPGNKSLFIPGDESRNVNPHVFAITAIGWGRDANMYSVIQSTYRTGAGSNFTY